MMTTDEKLLQNIRNLRESKQFTQADMAEMLGISETGYAKTERGETEMKYRRLMQIASVLDVEISDLIPDNVIVSHSNDNTNVGNFNLMIGDTNLEAEIRNLHQIIDSKNELLASRDREIEVLKQQNATLQELVSVLKK